MQSSLTQRFSPGKRANESGWRNGDTWSVAGLTTNACEESNVDVEVDGVPGLPRSDDCNTAVLIAASGSACGPCATDDSTCSVHSLEHWPNAKNTHW